MTERTDSLSRELLRELAMETGGPRLSLFMPTHPGGAESRQDPIRLKNLLNRGHELLALRGHAQTAIEAVATRAKQLIANEALWRHREQGLALFLSSARTLTLHLPVSVEERVFGSERHHVRPLIPIVDGDGEFLVLALSQSQARLIEASRYEQRQLQVPGLEDIAESIFRDDDAQKTLQLHTGAPSHGGMRDPMYHGQGGGRDEREARLKTYCRQVQQVIASAGIGEGKPTVVSAVDYLASTYREVAHNGHLVDGLLLGNPDALDPSELRQRAWPLVAGCFAEARHRSASELPAGLARGTSTTDLDQALVAARDGRVASLFVSGDPCWGRYDATTRTVERTNAPHQGDDLLELAVAATLAHSGEVHGSLPDGLAGESPIAATFRY